MQNGQEDLGSRVHPDLKEYYAQMAPFLTPDKEVIEETRKIWDFLASTFMKVRSPHDRVPITTRQIPGPKDAPEVSVRIYNSQNDKTQRPGFLFIHGGAYVLGHPSHFDNICSLIAHEADCIVISPDYRLAPETTYPAAIEDCYATLVWMRDAAQELGINPKKIAIGGVSCGGGLCAALALMARDRNGPEICFQMPLYPMVDNRNVTPSSQEIVEKRVFCREGTVFGWEMYLRGKDKAELDPYAVPLRATDFSKLPPTFTFVGTLDVLRDETIEYVSKLIQAKVPVEFHLYPGCFHAFDLFFPDTEISKAANLSIVNALKKAFKA